VPAEPGIYRAQTGDRRLHALRNLLDANESDIRPRARFTLGGRRTAVTAADATEHHEIWPWLVALLLLFFVADALWATRKGAA